jgi:general secretion pathway protein D
MNRFLAAALAAALFVVVIDARAVAREGGKSAAPDMITMNFQNVDIPVLAKFISEITGKNFIIDESVRGKVSIISPTKVTPEQAYRMFQSVLQLKGFTTVQAGSAIKIIPAREVRSAAQLTESQQPFELKGDEYVTRMIRLKNVDASSLVNVIQPMVSHDGLIAAYPDDNTLIITDDAQNVQRLLKIIGSLDVKGTQANVKVFALKEAFATQLAPEIEDIMGARAGATTTTRQPPRPGIGGIAPATTGPSGAFKVIPDERTNSLVVLAGPLQMSQIEDIIAKLDVQPPNATARIHVYRLKNADALEMLDVLNSLVSGGGPPTMLSPSTGRNSLGRGATMGGMGMGMGGMGGGMGGGYGGMGGGVGGMGGMGGGYGGGMGGFGGSSFSGGFGGGSFGGGGLASRRSTGAFGSSGAGGGAGGAGGGKNSEFTGPVSLTADPGTNALVVAASPQDWQTLKQIVDQLDVPRVQVFVQAIIVEVSAERSREIGVTAYTSNGASQNILNFGQLQNAIGNPLGISGLGLGLATGGTCSIPAALASAVTATTTPTTGNVTVPCDLALMTALETDTHTDVLSAPTLLTADNEEATIVVGQNLPFVGSAAANAGLPGQIFNSVDRQNVGITLDMIPQVSEGDYIKLDLYEEVSNVVPGTANNSLGPTTTIRSASTTVLIQNHRTAVIGGLLSSQDSSQNQGIPFISDIPVLGNLFSDKSRDRQKQNLLIFLTPQIVRDRAQLRALALDERQKFINSVGRKELHDMPASQIRALYKPSLSISVPPEEDLNAQYGIGGAPALPTAPSSLPQPGSPPTGATPFNTEEIGPSSMKEKSTAASSLASTAAPAPSHASAATSAAGKAGAATAP